MSLRFIGNYRMSNTTWLNISGCPRSGTTALGSELNKSGDIALLHEHLPRDFFGPINSLFINAKLHRTHGAGNELFQSILCAERDFLPIVQSIFSCVFQKATSVIGTKCPNLHKYDTEQYPSGLVRKQIHITRHPIAVVNSYIIKGDSVCADNPEHAFCDWLTSLNYAIENYRAPNFMCLLYETFDGESNHEQAKQIASFLGVASDFDLNGLRAQATLPGPDFLEHPAGSRVFDAINRLFDLENWISSYSAILEKGRLVGYPLQKGETICLDVAGNGWKYVQRGFYPAETEGSWTHGSESVLCFTPDASLSGALAVMLDVSWLIEIQDEPTRFHLYLDDTLVGKASFLVGKSNGHANLFFFNVATFEQLSPSVVMRIVIENPRNLASMELSNDNRNLGLMVRGISFAS